MNTLYLRLNQCWTIALSTGWWILHGYGFGVHIAVQFVIYIEVALILQWCTTCSTFEAINMKIFIFNADKYTTTNRNNILVTHYTYHLFCFCVREENRKKIYINFNQFHFIFVHSIELNESNKFNTRLKSYIVEQTNFHSNTNNEWWFWVKIASRGRIQFGKRNKHYFERMNFRNRDTCIFWIVQPIQINHTGCTIQNHWVIINKVFNNITTTK